MGILMLMLIRILPEAYIIYVDMLFVVFCLLWPVGITRIIEVPTVVAVRYANV